MTRGLLRTLLLSLLLSIAGVTAVVVWLGRPGDLVQLTRLSAAPIALSLALLGVHFVAGGLRLQLLLAMTGVRVNGWRATRAFILGLFGAALTPSGGGSAPAIALSLVRDGVGSSLAWSVTVYGSILDLLFFGWSIPLSALLLHRLGVLGDTRLLWLALALSLVCLALWYALAFHLPRLRRLGGALFSLRLLRRWRRPGMRFLAGMSEATATMTRGNLGSHTLLQLLTAILHLGLYAIFFVFAQALHGDLGLLRTLAVLVLVSATSYLVPTPGGSGYLELAMSYVFSRQSDAGMVTAAVVAYRAVSYYGAILIGGILGGTVLIKEIARRSREPAVPPVPLERDG